MKNTMIPVVTLATALTAEYGTVHVCALDNSSDVYTEHDFSHTSEVSGTQEDEMEYQKAKADADNKREYLNSVSEQYKNARQETASAKKVLDEECDRLENDTEKEWTEAEENSKQAEQTKQEALNAVTDAQKNVDNAQKQLDEAEKDYKKLLDDLHIPYYAMDELNQQLEDTKKDYQDTVIEKNDTSSEISSLKQELGNQYLNLTSLKNNRDLKQEALTVAQQELENNTVTYNNLVKQISDIDENYPDLSSSITVAEQKKDSAKQIKNACQEILDDYKGRKTNWESVKSNGVNQNNLMYNSETGYYYTPEDVDSYISEIENVIENNTRDYELADTDYVNASALLDTLTDLKKKRDDLVTESNQYKAEADKAQTVVNAAASEFQNADNAYQSLYEQLSALVNQLDELEKKESDCCTKMDFCSNYISSIQDEIDALKKLKELCDCSTSRMAVYSNDSRSYVDIWKQIVEAKNKKETAKEVLNDANEELFEKKKAEQVACDALKEAEKKTEKAKEKYDSARASVLEIRKDGKLTSAEFSYLNKYLLAYNNAVKNENQLRQSYEQAKLEYDIAAGLIAPGSELYNRHMKYINSLSAYEKLLSDSSDVPETGTKKPVENTSVTADRRRNANEMMAGAILVSSLIFVTYSIMRVKRNRHEQA